MSNKIKNNLIDVATIAASIFIASTISLTTKINPIPIAVLATYAMIQLSDKIKINNKYK